MTSGAFGNPVDELMLSTDLFPALNSSSSSRANTLTGTTRAQSRLQIPPQSSSHERAELSPTLISAINNLNNLTIDNNSDDELSEDELEAVEGESSMHHNYHNTQAAMSTTTLASTPVQPVAPAEGMRAIVVNRPTTQMIEEFRLAKSRELMSEEEVLDFITKPVPQGQKVLCQITRSKEGFGKLYPQYELFVEDLSDQRCTFMLAARKRKKSKSSHYTITTQRLVAGDSPEFVVGKVKSNFLGTAFAIYSNGSNPFKRDPEQSELPVREELGAVVYDPNILGFKGPRKMTILLTGMTKSGERPEFRPTTEEETLIGKFRNGNVREMLVLHNKSPQWNEETQSYMLNFNRRVTVASVKNFQIVHDNDLEYIIMQFGRVSDDTFTMDFMYPMCPLQAFAIALTSFDAKLACE